MGGDGSCLTLHKDSIGHTIRVLKTLFKLVSLTKDLKSQLAANKKNENLAFRILAVLIQNGLKPIVSYRKCNTFDEFCVELLFLEILAPKDFASWSSNNFNCRTPLEIRFLKISWHL